MLTEHIYIASGLRARFRASKTSFPIDRSKVVFLLQFFLFVRL